MVGGVQRVNEFYTLYRGRHKKGNGMATKPRRALGPP